MDAIMHQIKVLDDIKFPFKILREVTIRKQSIQ